MLTTNIILIERINEIYPLVQTRDYFPKSAVSILPDFEETWLSFQAAYGSAEPGK